jgi:hypothetical protein
MANTTNYNWETPDDTDLVKDGAAAIRTLGNSIDTTTKALNPETTLGDIAYRSATSNTNTRLPIGSSGQILSVSGGVPAWINNDQGDITEVAAGTGISVASGTGPIPTVSINTAVTADLTTAQTLSNKTLTSPVLTTPTISTVDAKGDLLVGTADNTIGRLAVGTNDFVLTAASGETTGLKWAAASGGGLVKITRTSYSAVSTQAFDGVFTTTYKTYLVVIERSTGSSDNNLLFQFRDGSSTQNSLYYGQSFGYNYSSTLTNTSTNNASALTLIAAQGASGTRASSLQFYVTYVGAANGSGEFSLISGTAEIGNDTKTMVIGGGHYLSSADNDGFILSANTGTITGTVTVYGLAI